MALPLLLNPLPEIVDEAPDTINAYERLVYNKFLASDISWMPLGKAITMGSALTGASEDEHSKAQTLVMGRLGAHVHELKQELSSLKDSFGEDIAEMKKEMLSLIASL